MADEMPFNDPHTAAHNIWVWRKEKDYVYECSAVAIELTTQHRQALEDMLLWRHRVETQQSTLCNYGRFHPNWSKSLSRKKGIRGVRLKEGEINPNGGYSSLPLNQHSHETALDWMELQWSELMPLTLASIQNVPFAGGIYRIIDLDNNTIIYLGESKTLRSRLSTHCKAPWSTTKPYFSFAQPKGMAASHRRHELEVDLIGAFYCKYKRPPLEQY
ncbi:GIY-YIG nuclease family protein [Vibrio parahaemolyticus]